MRGYITSKVAVLALLVCGVIGYASPAFATYTAPTVTVESLFDWAAIALVVLTLGAAVIAASGGVKLAMNWGSKFIKSLGAKTPRV